MTARLMDLIVRYHELPKGEIVTKRDEIARELTDLFINENGFERNPTPEQIAASIEAATLSMRSRLAEQAAELEALKGTCGDCWTRLAEREAETERLKNVLVLAQTELFRIPCQGYKEWREVTDLIDKVLAAPRKEPRNDE